jgi:hypothetical protein
MDLRREWAVVAGDESSIQKLRVHKLRGRA